MFFNEHIKNIKRVKNYRPTQSQNKRFDMAERSINFEEDFYEKFIQTLTQEDFITYPSQKVYDSLSEKIAKRFSLEKDNILLSPGSASGISLVIQATCSKFKKVLCPFPCFPMYFVYSDFHDVTFEKVFYGRQGLNLEDIKEKIDKDVGLVVLTNPNSPMGEYKSQDEIEDLCTRALEKEVIVLVDEAYIDFSPGTCVDLVKKYENLLILRTLSKGWGAAGSRVGYIIGQKKQISILEKIQHPYPLPGASIKFASYLIDNEDVVIDYCDSTISERNKICELLSKTNKFFTINSHTNFIHFREIEDKNNTKTVDLLEKHDIACKKSVSIDEEDVKWIRIAIGPNMSDLAFFRELVKI